jgi:predicted transcriptional regulator
MEGIEMIRLKLRELLDERNITQSKFSRMSDIPLNTIQMLCRQPYHDTLLSTLERISKGLNVPVCALFEIIEDNPKRE